MEPVTDERHAEPLTEYVQRTTWRVRALDRRHPLVWDLLITGFWVTAALIDGMGGGWLNVALDPTVPDGLILTLSLGLSLPLLWRRTHPRTALLAVAPFAFVNAWTGAVLQAALLQLLLVYHLALRRPLRHLVWATALIIAPISVTLSRYDGEGTWNQQLGSQLLSIATAVLIGVTVRTRRDRTEALEDRARRLETERDQQAQLAAAAERARIAREMHDIIGHHLSVVTGLADGGRYAAARSPERAAQALDAIATTSREALGELRRLLDVLRDDEQEKAELSPQPSLTDLDRLISGVRSAGLPVRTTVQGTASLAPGRQLAVYRVVQEALTNTLKHAGPDATAHIDLAYADGGAVTLTVTDSGHGGPVTAPTDGRGLPGMRERTALYGGTLEAGPRTGSERGWRVRFHLPEERPQ
ncbi:sensor histidine kinase [Streptomyces sp. CRN 30]|uniref:sensor histidine kinase n=1 Tax=Streptomyces sp. CRN 30 TaxID=3075613 RepID=UPI002A836C43|nr:histidine kinase [Streptomyces sp. CRN 30]